MESSSSVRAVNSSRSALVRRSRSVILAYVVALDCVPATLCLRTDSFGSAPTLPVPLCVLATGWISFHSVILAPCLKFFCESCASVFVWWYCAGHSLPLSSVHKWQASVNYEEVQQSPMIIRYCGDCWTFRLLACLRIDYRLSVSCSLYMGPYCSSLSTWDLTYQTHPFDILLDSMDGLSG